jgi:hypothetical protein
MAQQEEPQASHTPPQDSQVTTSPDLAGTIAAALSQADLPLGQTLQFAANLIPFEFKSGAFTAAKISWAGLEFSAGPLRRSLYTSVSLQAQVAKPFGAIQAGALGGPYLRYQPCGRRVAHR